MLLSSASLRSHLDELALDALGPPPPLPAARVLDGDESIEILFEDEAGIDELAATGQFVRFSAPYERIEIEEVPSLAALSAKPTSFKRRQTTTFARTITAEQRRITTPIEVPLAAIQAMAPASATVPFERVWFEDDEDVRLAAIEDPPVEVKQSWWWLAISLVAGGAAVAAMAIWL